MAESRFKFPGFTTVGINPSPQRPGEAMRKAWLYSSSSRFGAIVLSVTIRFANRSSVESIRLHRCILWRHFAERIVYFGSSPILLAMLFPPIHAMCLILWRSAAEET